MCLQNQWYFYKNLVSFPYRRNVGVNGRSVNFKSSTELFDFFENDKDSDILWLDSEDFKVVSNLYQVKIKIITHQNDLDITPIVNMIEPDNEMKHLAWIPEGLISEIVILHKHETHFDLITSKESKLMKGISKPNIDIIELMDDSDVNVVSQVETVNLIENMDIDQSQKTNVGDDAILEFLGSIVLIDLDKKNFQC